MGGSFLEVKKYDIWLKEGDEKASVSTGLICNSHDTTWAVGSVLQVWECSSQL